MAFQLSDTPDWISGAVDESTHGAPQIGDLWTLAWDGHYEGTVIVADVFAHHILGLPVTAGEASAREVALLRDRVSLTLWPQAETGLGTFLLHARIGVALTPDQVLEIRRWEAQRGELWTVSSGSAAVEPERLRKLLPHYQRLCFIDWPSDAEATLDIASLGMSPREFATETGLPAARVLALWSGLPVTEDERELLGPRAENWLTIAPDAATDALSAPALKDLFSELITLTGADERSARNVARKEYALAARTDSAVARDATRAADTLRALIAEARASLD